MNPKGKYIQGIIHDFRHYFSIYFFSELCSFCYLWQITDIMKSFSAILQIVLVLAVAGLYILHFSNKPKEVVTGDSSKVEIAPSAITAPVGGMVFINSDSLLDNYDYFKTKKIEFEARQNRIKSELEAESTKLQKDVESYQRRAPGMTDIQRQIEEEQLMMRQQKLMERKDELLDKLDDEQAKSSEQLYNRLSTFLKEYNKDKNYQFILGFQKGGGILFANDSLDITANVLQGLNEQYKNEKK